MSQPIHGHNASVRVSNDHRKHVMNGEIIMAEASRVGVASNLEMRGASCVVTANEVKIWSKPLINIGKPTVCLIESVTYKFAKCLQRRFGIVEDVTDHGYITNSYHVNVREDIDAFTKLGFEAQFQHMSPGGLLNVAYASLPKLREPMPKGCRSLVCG